jgi:hypothetical protein
MQETTQVPPQKNFLRSLFLSYTFTDKKKDIKDMLFEIFKFFKHHIDSIAFFKLMFNFLAQEAVLAPEETKALLAQYLSPIETEGVMNTYQILRQEGRQEKARSMVLRGKWNKIPAESLADQAELPLAEVKNLLIGYDKVYKLWVKNKGKTPEVLPQIAHLSEQEVSYLMTFFSQKQAVVAA